MAINDFLSFCPTTTGTNLLSQADYLTDPQLAIGNQPGVARSKLDNKALRQATYIAHCLSQYLVNMTGDDVLDNATPSAVIATLAKALQPRQQVRVNTGNGYGSTNNVIRRFLNQDINIGSNITYADSATLGATFTINKTGVYTIIRYEASTVTSEFGLSVNSTQLTTAVETISLATYLGMVIIDGALPPLPPVCLSVTSIFTAGDVIRPHDGGSVTGSTDRNIMTITQVSF